MKACTIHVLVVRLRGSSEALLSVNLYDFAASASEAPPGRDGEVEELLHMPADPNIDASRHSNKSCSVEDGRNMNG